MQRLAINRLKMGAFRTMMRNAARLAAILVDGSRFGRKQFAVSRFLLCLALATAIAWAVACNEKGDISSTISGIVLDSVSRAAIDSAWVSTSENNREARYTDSTGSFTLTSFGRPHRIFAGKAGYLTKTQLVPGTNLEVKGVTIELVSDTL